MSREKKEWNCWVLPYIFSSRDYAGQIMIKMTINTMIQMRDKTTNATQDQKELKGWKQK